MKTRGFTLCTTTNPTLCIRMVAEQVVSSIRWLRPLHDASRRSECTQFDQWLPPYWFKVKLCGRPSTSLKNHMVAAARVPRSLTGMPSHGCHNILTLSRRSRTRRNISITCAAASSTVATPKSSHALRSMRVYSQGG